jgi:hypothetical protein
LEKRELELDDHRFAARQLPGRVAPPGCPKVIVKLDWPGPKLRSLRNLDAINLCDDMGALKKLPALATSLRTPAERQVDVGVPVDYYLAVLKDDAAQDVDVDRFRSLCWHYNDERHERR